MGDLKKVYRLVEISCYCLYYYYKLKYTSNILRKIIYLKRFYFNNCYILKLIFRRDFLLQLLYVLLFAVIY
jgi:hypothetical protein